MLLTVTGVTAVLFPSLQKNLHACWLWLRPLTKGISAQALLIAVLAHGLLAALLLQWRPQLLVTKAADNGQIIHVQLTTPLAPQAKLQTAAAQDLQPAGLNSAASAPELPSVKDIAKPAQQAAKTIRRKQITAATSPPMQSKPTVSQPRTNSTTSEPVMAAGAKLNADAIMQHYIDHYQAKALTSAELQSMQQSKTGRQLAAAAPRKRANTPDQHADVVAVLNNGARVERLSADHCVIAESGADLRKDIHSIRLTPCPDSNSDAAMFERIMADIGKH